MNEQELAFVMSTGKLSQKVPPPVSLLDVAVVFFKLLSRPKDRFHRDRVEALGVEDCGLIVIAQNRQLAIFDDRVEALDWVGAITNDISEAENLVNFKVSNGFHDRRECFKVSMDVADDCPLH